MRGARQATLPQAWAARPAPPPEPDADGDPAEDALLAAAALEAEAGPSFAAGPAGALWVFPRGGRLEERAYQVRAARAALLSNTLLCLPTGLGKTLVAAVVLYNFHRWFPGGRVLFLAPTKPLVAQQRQACARLMGIPAAHMAEMTGTLLGLRGACPRPSTTRLAPGCDPQFDKHCGGLSRGGKQRGLACRGSGAA